MDEKSSNFATLCRLCLQPGDELTDIFADIPSPYQLPKISLPSKIMACVSIKILPTDPGPRKICGKCLESINSWFEFNEECKLANAVLQKFLSELSTKAKSTDTVEGKVCESSQPNENSLLGEISLLGYDSVLEKNVNFGPNLSSFLDYCFSSNQTKTVKDSSFAASHDFSINTESQSLGSFTCNALSPMDLSMHGEEIRPDILWRCDVSVGNKIEQDVNNENLPNSIDDQFGKCKSLDPNKASLGLDDLHSEIDKDEHLEEHKMLTSNKLNLNDASSRVDINKVFEKQGILIPNKTNLDFSSLGAQDVAGEPLSPTQINVGVAGASFLDDVDRDPASLDVKDPLDTAEVTDYACELCSSKFSRFIDLVNHDDRKHETIVKNYCCSICKRLFISANRLKMHQDRHREKTHKCSTCNKLFVSRKSLAVHNRLHTGKYKCDMCQYVTTSKLYLKHHLLKHEGQEIEFVCQVCGKTFSRKSSLQRHTNTHLKHKGKVYKCLKCNTFTRTPSELADHMNVHSNFKNVFTCQTCRKFFKSKRSLQNHMTRHKEAKFVCEVCDKRLYSYYQLHAHEATHTDIKPFRCFHCSKQFSFQNTLVKHLQKTYPRIRSDILVE